MPISSSSIFKWVVLGLGLVLLIIAVRFAPLARWIEALAAWTATHPLSGALLYILAYITGTLLFVPGSLLTLAAGVAFGWWGIPLALASATTGAAAAFLLARYLGRPWIEKKATAHPKFRAMDQAIGSNGWKIVALLRLSPLVPFNAANYLFGLTQIRFLPYVLATFVGMMPGAVLYVYLGHLGKVSLSSQHRHSMTPAQWTLLGIGLAATLILALYLAHIAKKTLRWKS